MKSNYIHLHYWNQSDSKEHKEKVGNYLDFLCGKTKGLFLKNVPIFSKDKTEGFSNGHVFVRNLEKSRDFFEGVLKYFLSKNKTYIPITISCSRKKIMI